MLDRWDHTACLIACVQNLTILVSNIGTKGKKIKPVAFEDVHPFREKRPRGFVVTVDNFMMLKQVAAAAVRR